MSFDREKWTIIGGICAMVLSGGLVAATWIGGPADVVATDDQIPERTLNAQKEIEAVIAAEKAAIAKDTADQEKRDRIAEDENNKAVADQIERERLVKQAAEEHEQEVAAQFITSKVSIAEAEKQKNEVSQAEQPLEQEEMATEVAKETVVDIDKEPSAIKKLETQAELLKQNKLAAQREAELAAQKAQQELNARKKVEEVKRAELAALQERARKLAEQQKVEAQKREQELLAAQQRLQEFQETQTSKVVSPDESEKSVGEQAETQAKPAQENVVKSVKTITEKVETVVVAPKTQESPIAVTTPTITPLDSDADQTTAAFDTATIVEIAKEKDVARAKWDAKKSDNVLSAAPKQVIKQVKPQAKKKQANTTNNANLLPRVAKNSIAAQIAGCWKSPQLFAENNDNRITLRVALNKQGFLLSSPKMTNWTADNFARSDGFNIARRALTRCQPYQLPVQSYASWRNLSIVFGPQSVSVK
ncbi:hypothetical protein GCM10008927_14780 [Amylibacter ulvae]|uniref:TolA protein n=1 Tax=Paramylibacter ulvae TaxID=1651968 RepID=A0ABQ3D1H1_9RHOB|nr:hypothetical protein [Amylibacter ulvae]GHA50651.1 hypothetical protein GCM10008927_14780 [Amylibacter ulvae]